MFSWIEKRLKLKKFFLAPLIPRRILCWNYFPGFFCILLLIIQFIRGFFLAYNFKEGNNIFNKNLHWALGSTLLLFCIIHILVGIYHALYRNPGEIKWVSGFILFTLIIINFTIGLIISNYNNKDDIILKFLSKFENNQNILFHKLYTLHTIIIPFFIIIFLFFHLWLLSRSKSLFKKRD